MNGEIYNRFTSNNFSEYMYDYLGPKIQSLYTKTNAILIFFKLNDFHKKNFFDRMNFFWQKIKHFLSINGGFN